MLKYCQETTAPVVQILDDSFKHLQPNDIDPKIQRFPFYFSGPRDERSREHGSGKAGSVVRGHRSSDHPALGYWHSL